MSDNTGTWIGRVAQDPDLKFINSGKATVKFSIAVEKSWLNRQTQQREKKVSFFNVTAWDTLAENVANSLHKGQRVIVTGTLEVDQWETEDGQKRSAVKIVADGIGPDLRFNTCTMHSTERPQTSATPDFNAEDAF